VRTHHPTRHFIAHYAEMVVAMLAGMALLGIPAVAVLSALGTSTADLQADAPALLLFGMALTMTVPMVAWMRFRGHGWPASAEMAASMFVPTLAAVALLATRAVTETETLLSVQHIAMLPSMLVAMLARREEYTGGAHNHEVTA
jgi:hypothetical protein